jgi:hypothetical protein
MERTFTQEIKPTPRELAEEFCNMDGDKQAEFFSEIAAIKDTWDFPFVFQLQAITDSPKLTDEGRQVMADIGEYAPKYQEEG